MKVLITGGAGFIGSHVARALMDQGAEVVLFDNFDSFLYSAELKEERINHMFERDKRPKLISGDILDKDLVEKVFSEETFDKVIHLAALANPGKSLTAAEAYSLVNIMGTINILDACTRHDVSHVIVAGSSSVYNDEQTPFIETSYPLRPRSPYGASKASMETYCALWNELYDLRVTVLRFFSVYGPWGRPDMAPMIFAQRILNDETIYLTPDRKRDFTFISDIVSGILAAVEQRFDFEIINLGRGEPQSLEDFIAALEAASGKKARIESQPEPAGEMRVTYADVSKAKELLGYEPKVSIQDGTRQLIDWVKEYSK